AESAVDAKNQFLTKMSHELRTPLTAISGYADLLLDYIRDEDALEPIMSIRRNGQYLLRALNDILNLAHIEQGRIQLEPRAVEIRTTVRNVLDSAGARAAAKGIPIHMDLSPELPRIVRLDPVRVCQVLTQLLGNAVKYTELGRITVSVDCHRGSESLLRFRIQDTGIGIAPDRLEAIFEPFCQGDDSMTRRHTGSGLGLSLCRQLSRLLGGKLSVESTPGNGSTFQLVIPLEAVTTGEDKEAPATQPSTEETQNLWAGLARPPLNCRILLVEDGIDNRRLISLILRKAGAQVDLAENGQIGVEMALSTFPGYGNRYDDPSEPYDLVLMDIQMPVLDGYDATRQLRSAGFIKPIIALTAHALAGDREKCLAAGCDDYATKPIHRENLLELLRLYADKSREIENTPGIAYENPIETA
ncbi:MAG: ATP-binding protein, partial [Pirellulaceae bacterium]